MSAEQPATPNEAEAAFYAAFERRDIEAMMSLWLDDDGICCVHPLGPLLRGRTEIRRSWQDIFSSSPPLRFRIERRLELRTADLAIHVVSEHIQVLDPGRGSHTVLATNAYRLTHTGWGLVLHHATPAQGASADKPPPTLH